MGGSGPVIVIVILEFIKGVVHGKLRSDFQMVRGDTVAVKVS